MRGSEQVAALVHRTKQMVHHVFGATRCTTSKLVGRLIQTDEPFVWVGPLAVLATAAAGPALAAEPVLVQCGREYQAAKAAGTLNGADWNRYRVDCATRLKAEPAAAAAQPLAASPVAPAVTAPLSAPPSPPPPAASAAAGGGRAAMNGRQKQCGAEWRAQKAVLVVQTPGLTWPRYWSQCNARLKAAGG